jgi:hypothetical protein
MTLMGDAESGLQISRNKQKKEQKKKKEKKRQYRTQVQGKAELIVRASIRKRYR